MKTYVQLWYRTKFFLEREMFQIKLVEEIKTHILYSVTFTENSAVYEIMWKNMIDLQRPQMKI
jgi:hypothetical protein